jgi:CheY-like chemotaxis protein
MKSRKLPPVGEVGAWSLLAAGRWHGRAIPDYRLRRENEASTQTSLEVAMPFLHLENQRHVIATEKRTARILIADDSALVRQQLRSLLEMNSDWEVCGEAVDGREAVEKARQLQPDLVVLDFSMPVMNGLQAAKEISQQFPHIPLLLFSMFLSRQLVEEARKLGFRGAVAKSDVSRDLLNGVESLLQDREFFPSNF